jgi:hypothetical protein
MRDFAEVCIVLHRRGGCRRRPPVANAGGNIAQAARKPSRKLSLHPYIATRTGGTSDDRMVVISSSANNATFTTVFSGVISEVGGVAESETFATVTARYLRVTASDASLWMSYGNVEVINDPSGIPEPSSWAQLGFGLLGLHVVRRRYALQAPGS